MNDRTVRAVMLKAFGGPEVLTLGKVPRPVPGEGQVLIKVAATSVNRADIVQREGRYPPPPGESDILGLEVAGEVTAAGPAVTNWRAGDRVMTLVGGGGYAEWAVAWADHLIPVPAGMPLAEAAAVCETYITAFLNIFLIGALADGEFVLLHGGGGGVNTAGVQLCRLLTPRARIFVTASAGKLARVKALGVDRVIDYRSEDFAAVVREATAGHGADVILDHIGASYLAPNLKALATGGRLVIIGLMGGATAQINLGRLMVKRQRVIGSVLRSLPVARKAEIVRQFRDRVLPAFAEGRLRPVIDEVLPLEKAAEAHRKMADSRHFGKIVLRVAPCA